MKENTINTSFDEVGVSMTKPSSLVVGFTWTFSVNLVCVHVTNEDDYLVIETLFYLKWMNNLLCFSN